MVTIEELLEQHFGIIKTSWAKQAGIHSQTLKRYVEKGMLVQEGNGFYSDAENGVNEYYLVKEKYPQGILSRKTVLILFGLSDEFNWHYDITFPRGTHNQSFEKNFVQPHFTNEHLFELGKEEYHFPTGEEIAIYNLERTLVDIWNPRNQYDNETKEEAVIRAINYPHIHLNIKKLEEYSQKLNIGNALLRFVEKENYLESA